MREAKKGDPKDHLANERTFLAWMRTAIGIMAFGFVIERAAIFLKQILLGLRKEAIPIDPISLAHERQAALFGIILVVMGVVIALLALVNYKKGMKQISENRYHPSLFLSVVLTVAILIIGIFLVLSLN